MHWKISPQVFLVATYLVLLSALSALLVSCGGGGGGSDGGSNVSAPTVSQTSPKANSSSIPVTTTVSAEINEALDAATISPGTFSVITMNGPVSGTVVYSGTRITFLPDSPFEYNTTYTAIVSADIENLDGVPLATEYSWEFTTVAIGPGDPQNYIPFEPGSSWIYQGTITEPGATPISYVNEISINGNHEVDGKSTTVFIESNPYNSGIPIEGYLIKDLNGVTYYGDNDLSDTITPQIVPYQEVNFPATPGYSFTQIHKTGLDFGEDVDSDGVNESFDVISTVTYIGLETVIVPAGEFVDCARVDTNILIEVRASSDNSSYEFQGFGSEWYAPGVGPIKMIGETTDPEGSTETISEVLTNYFQPQFNVSATGAFVQYRTSESPNNNRYVAYIDFRNNGQFIQEDDVQSVELYDQNTVQIIPNVPPQFILNPYTVARWNTATSQFEYIAASGDSGYWFDLSNYLSITPGLLSFYVQPSQGLPFEYVVNFPAQISLVPVTSASMFSQWNADGSLTLFWSEPIDTFDQYRVVFTDSNNKGIFYGRVSPGVTQVTLSESLIDEISVTGQLNFPTTINWRMQTRNYDGVNNYARSFSNPVPINWP